MGDILFCLGLSFFCILYDLSQHEMNFVWVWEATKKCARGFCAKVRLTRKPMGKRDFEALMATNQLNARKLAIADTNTLHGK